MTKSDLLRRIADKCDSDPAFESALFISCVVRNRPQIDARAIMEAMELPYTLTEGYSENAEPLGLEWRHDGMVFAVRADTKTIARPTVQTKELTVTKWILNT